MDGTKRAAETLGLLPIGKESGRRAFLSGRSFCVSRGGPRGNEDPGGSRSKVP